MVEIMTEKQKRAILNHKGTEVFGPYERILSGGKRNVIKDYSKNSPNIFAAIASNARGEEKKVINPNVRGIEKKHNPVSPEFMMGFEVKHDD